MRFCQNVILNFSTRSNRKSEIWTQTHGVLKLETVIRLLMYVDQKISTPCLKIVIIEIIQTTFFFPPWFLFLFLFQGMLLLLSSLY